MLMIYFRMGIVWVAEVANTGIRYSFAGIGPEEQLENVQAFAQTLAVGQDDIYQFFRSPELPPGELEQQLFGDTNVVIFEDFDLAFDDELVYNTVAVGEFILDLLL